MRGFVLAMLACGICLRDADSQAVPWQSPWILLSGSDGGAVSSLVAGEGVLLAATRAHNIFRSVDTGKTWLPYPAGTGTHTTVFYDATAKLFYGSGHDALFASAPAAAAWTRISAGSSTLFSADGPTVIRYGNPGESLQVSLDGGRTWKNSVYPKVHMTVVSVLARDTCVFYSNTDTSVCMSCDGGNTWKPTGSGYTSVYAASLVRHQESMMASAHGTIIRSQDGGRTWAPWAGNLEGENRVHRIGQSIGALYAWSPKDTLYRSQDGGISWAVLGVPNPEGIRSGTTSALAEVGGNLFAAVSDGIKTSSDGGRTWRRIPLGSIQGPIVSLYVQGHKQVLLAGNGLFTSRDSGASWRVVFPDSGAATWTTVSGTGGLYAAGTRDGQVHVSTDSGSTWSPAGRLPASSTVISVAVSFRRLYAGTLGGLWRRNETDGAWSKLPLPAADIPRYLFTGRNSLLIAGDSHIWQMREDGTFQDISAGLRPYILQGLWHVDDRMYAATHDGALYQWDLERSAWTPMTGFTGFAFSIAGTGPYRLLATSDGLYGSEDQGAHWVQMPASGVRKEEIRVLTFSDRRLYAGDSKGGVWRWSWEFPDVATGIAAAGRKPRGIGLKGPYGVLRERQTRADGRKGKFEAGRP